MTRQTTITCNECGTEIKPESGHWTASFVPPTNTTGILNTVWNEPSWDARLDICHECVQPVLGELIWKTRNRERVPTGTCPANVTTGIKSVPAAPCGTKRPCPEHDQGGTQ